MSSQLRPLTSVEILDAAFLLLRRNGAQWYACSVVGTVPLAVLILVYFWWLGTIVEGTDDAYFYMGTVTWGLAMALGWMVNTISRSAVIAAAQAEARGSAIGAWEAYRIALRRAPDSIFVGLAGFAAAWLASCVLVAPALFLAAAWWVAQPAVIEGQRFTGALRRSAQLTDGHRGKPLALWLLLVLVWMLTLLNLHLLIGAGVTLLNFLFGFDTSALEPRLRFSNQVYATTLFAAALALLDPLKSIIDALLYLDLRIRREGADLHERLAALRAVAAAALGGLLLAACARPAAAIPEAGYISRIQQMRGQIERARSSRDVDPMLVSGLRRQFVETPGGAKITVDNDWLREKLGNWKNPSDKADLLERLDALQRSLGGTGSAVVSLPGDSGGVEDPRGMIKQLLEDPEFRPLAERPELSRLAGKVDFRQSRSWWRSFWDWIQKSFFKPRQPRVEAPIPRAINLDFLVPVFYFVLGVALALLAAIFIRWLVEGGSRRQKHLRGASAVAPLAASQTENALDYSVDDWESFARQWFERGDVRQAVRALYLATLVHLHRSRRIDYNRALTNWVYVRQFKGDLEQQGILRRLTRIFDEVWYGERACGEERSRTVEEGARALGTPAPLAAGGGS